MNLGNHSESAQAQDNSSTFLTQTSTSGVSAAVVSQKRGACFFFFLNEESYGKKWKHEQVTQNLW